VLSETRPREPTRKHAAYDSLELNRRWTPLWGMDCGGWSAGQRQLRKDRRSGGRWRLDFRAPLTIRQGLSLRRDPELLRGAERRRNVCRDGSARLSPRLELLRAIVTNCPPKECRHTGAAALRDQGRDVGSDPRCRSSASAQSGTPGNGSSPQQCRLVRRTRAAVVRSRGTLRWVPRSPASVGRWPASLVDDDWPSSRSAESA
jgi:hypothetical protein